MKRDRLSAPESSTWGTSAYPPLCSSQTRALLTFVWGFQRDSPTSGHKIALLNYGESPLVDEEPGLQELVNKVVNANKFRCTTDFAKISEVEAITLLIQTPFASVEILEPDYGPLAEGLKVVGRHLQEGALVVLESTVTPGTTTGVAQQILEEGPGMTAGEDFALAHAPERVTAAKLLRNIQKLDRIVGGIDQTCTQRAIELYTPVLTHGRISNYGSLGGSHKNCRECILRFTDRGD